MTTAIATAPNRRRWRVRRRLLADENGNGICDVDELQTSTNCGWGTYWNEDSMACVLLVPPYLGDYGDFSALNPCYFNLDNSSSVGAEDLLSFLGVYGQAADCAGYADAANAPWSCGDPVSYQGYDYATVLIGDQCWFAENLRSEQYRNGDPISSGLNDVEWANSTDGAFTVYGGDTGQCSSDAPNGDACDAWWSFENYGLLYNWLAIDDPRFLCPNEWHISRDIDWINLEIFLGMSDSIAFAFNWRGDDEGTQLKTSANWAWSSVPGSNSIGFSAVPGGFRSQAGGYAHAGADGWWWTEEGLYRNLNFGQGQIFRSWGEPPVLSVSRRGHSVRCIQDAE